MQTNPESATAAFQSLEPAHMHCHFSTAHLEREVRHGWPRAGEDAGVMLRGRAAGHSHQHLMTFLLLFYDNS
jgi:hypothetical protein